MTRIDGRTAAQLRPVHITHNYLQYPAGSVLIEVGNTKVICAATIEEKVPPFLKGKGEGWITAEYSLLPASTQTRSPRESARGKVTGRTHEIQRLIGRSLRSVVDLTALGERTIWIDCDVIQADGGTRTASITGAFVAVVEAIAKIADPQLPFPVTDYLAAISVGMSQDGPLLDLCYAEDSKAIVDMNLVMTGRGTIVEIQATGEQAPFSKDEFNQMMMMAEQGIGQLIELQRQVLGETGTRIVAR